MKKQKELHSNFQSIKMIIVYDSNDTENEKGLYMRIKILISAVD